MPSFQYTVVYIIANFLLYMFLLIAAHINCEYRFSRVRTLLLDALGFAGYAAISWTLPLMSTIRAVIGFLYVILLVVLLNKGRLLIRLLAGAASCLSMYFSEILFMAMMPRDLAVTGELMLRYPIPVYTALLFVNLVVLSVTVVFVRMIKRRRSGAFAGLRGLLFLAFPLSQFAAVWSYVKIYRDMTVPMDPWQILPSIIIYLLADVALFFAFRMAEKNTEMTVRNELLEEQISFQKDYYAELSASYEEVRKMRHDIDNHLYTMQAMMEAGQTKEAAAYVREVTARDTARQAFAGCGNMVVASYLTKKNEDFERQGIALEADIRLPAETGIANPDLICVFGNILDNAQEACEGLAAPKVELKAQYQRPYLSISCVNPVQEAQKEPASRKTRIPGLERGIGLTILSDLAGRYDGRLETGPVEEGFRTQLVLKGTYQE